MMNRNDWARVRSLFSLIPSQDQVALAQFPELFELAREHLQEPSDQEPTGEASLLMGYIEQHGGVTGLAVINTLRFWIYDQLRQQKDETPSVDESFGNKSFPYLTELAVDPEEQHIIFAAGFYEQFNFSHSHLIHPLLTEDLPFNRNGEIAFKGCDFSHSYWSVPIILSVDFEDCRFDDFRSHAGIFRSSKFQDCSFQRANLVDDSTLYFEESWFIQCDFEKASMSGVMFRDSYLSDVSFRDAHLKNVTFLSVSIEDSSFEGCTFEDCHFEHSAFEALPFGATFINCSFVVVDYGDGGFQQYSMTHSGLSSQNTVQNCTFTADFD